MLKIVNVFYMSDIKKLRDLLNLSQEQLAQRLGTTARTIQNWESGRVVPKSKIGLLRQLAAQFPNETFSMFEATNSPGAGLLNDVRGISSEDLKNILEEINSQRKDYMIVIQKRDEQIDRLLSLLEKK